MILYRLFIVLIVVLSLLSCSKDNNEQQIDKKGSGKILVLFDNVVKGESLIRNTYCYVNMAGNTYEISEVKYFISDLVFYRKDGYIKNIDGWGKIHYVDIDYPSTLEWNVYDNIPLGEYDSVAFIFGIRDQENISFMYVNPPEVNMFWPEVLGGGYHYLMINGKWLDNNNQSKIYNFHIGRGQLYKSNVINVDSIYGFVDNSFRVVFKNINLSIKEGYTTKLKITMDINSWFEGPYIYDHNVWGGDIMQKQEAMAIAVANGKDAFSFEVLD